MRLSTLLAAFLLTTSTSVYAAPCGDFDVACLSSRLQTAKLRKSQTKAHRALAKAQQKAWIADCVAERTGPVGGVSVAEARDICNAEVPSLDELRTDPTADPRPARH